MIPTNDIKYDDNTDPYRSEIMGTYARLKIWREYDKIIHIPTKIQLSCDNETTLEVAANYSRWNLGMQHFEIVQSAINIGTSLISSVVAVHVLGHADIKKKNRKPIRPLTPSLNKPVKQIHLYHLCI